MTVQSSQIEALVRPAIPADAPFIFSTWLRDLRKADGSPLPDDIWFTAYREYLNRIMADPKVQVLIVHPSDEPNEILGYVVAEPNEALFWIQIKPRYRGKYGLCKLLLKAASAEDVPSAFQTPDSKLKLRNPRRSRQLRSLYNRRTG